jgi:excinuclease ABC subunit C
MVIPNLPSKTGVYLFKNAQGQVIYVGKAVNLKSRVHSYFQNNLLPKTSLLVSEIESIDYIEVQSEIEALILEANLIKKFRPRYNVRLKDDKDYLYIKVTKEKYPRIITARLRDLDAAKIYFGPFPNSRAVRQTIRLIQKLFPHWICKNPPGQTCLYAHINLCFGPCRKDFEPKEYEKRVHQIILFLKGKKDKVVKQITKEMNQKAKDLNFEKAALLRDQLESINYVTTQTRLVSHYLQNPNLLDDLRREELHQLEEILNLKKIPARIECYDISNTMGKEASGSMIVFTQAQADKSQYRKFKIKRSPGVDDYAMLKEVLQRRFKNTWPSPDLIVIDGGKGQLKVACEVLKETGRDIPIISLAKRREEIFLPIQPASLKLPQSSPALQLIQRLRDEAHRFALNYHRHLRRKSFLHS